MGPWTLISIIFTLYVISVAAFVISENRSPQSTFAWLFLFVVFPLLGVLIYIFFGRGAHTFSQERDIARSKLSDEFTADLGTIAGRQEEYIQRIAQERPSSYKKRLLRLVQQSTSSILTGMNQVGILQDATQKYPRLLADIRAAQHHVHLNYYIWTEDEFTLQVKEAIIDRAKAGVEVRCLFDASGGAMSKQYLQDLRGAGVQIHPYMEFRSLKMLHTANYRSHRKIAVIDGRIGYVGGLNLDKEQIEPPAFDRWRDTHLRMMALWDFVGFGVKREA